MKSLKKLTCLLLALIMIFAASAETFAFGIKSLRDTEKPVYKVVSLGDSTAVGVGLNDLGIYGMDNFQYGQTVDYNLDYLASLGFDKYASKYSYANQLVNYIKTTKTGYHVQYTNLAMSGMRANEMRALIDPAFAALADTYKNHKNSIYSSLYNYVYQGNLGAHFIQAVTDADLILVDCVMNCFTSYLADRLGNPNGTYYKDGLDVVLNQVSPELAEKYLNARKSFVDTFGNGIVDNDIVKVLDTLAYVALDLAINTDGLIKSIRKINKKATILVSGTYNPFRGMDVDILGIKVSLERIVDIVFDLANSYLHYFAPNRSEYTYYDTPRNVETNREMMSKYKDAREIPNETLFIIIDNLERNRTVDFEDIFDDDSIDTKKVIAAITDVKVNKLGADKENIEIANRMYKYLNILLKGIQVDSINLISALELALDNSKDRDVTGELDKPLWKLSDDTKTIAFLIAEQDVRGGAAAHFSKYGCYQKYLAARTAYKLATCPILNK